MKLSKKQVEHIALLSRLGLTKEEIKKYQHQLSDVLEYISQVNELPTEDVEDISILELSNITREDTSKSKWKREDLLSNVPIQENGNIIVPEVFKG